MKTVAIRWLTMLLLGLAFARPAAAQSDPASVPILAKLIGQTLTCPKSDRVTNGTFGMRFERRGANKVAIVRIASANLIGNKAEPADEIVFKPDGTVSANMSVYMPVLGSVEFYESGLALKQLSADDRPRESFAVFVDGNVLHWVFFLKGAPYSYSRCYFELPTQPGPAVTKSSVFAQFPSLEATISKLGARYVPGTSPATMASALTQPSATSATCRDVTQVFYVGGREVSQKQRICRNAQGTWEAIDKPIPVAAPAAVASAPPPPTASSATATAAVVPTTPRVALIVGNSAYDARFGSLANPVRDAAAMGAALRASGFDVEVVQNADQKEMKRALQRFGQRLARAGRQATGLFFYAGHGVQSAGANYLVPINAAIENEGDVDLEAVAAEAVLRQMEAAGISTSIVILDACRNMPLARASRDGSRGLARMDAPNGSFIAYSTAPGQVAADGSGGNSPFTAALIAEIAKPGQEIQKTFLNVRRAVHQASGGKQVPWESSSLLDTFVFTPTK